MYTKRNYGFFMTLNWSKKPLIIGLLYSGLLFGLFYFLNIRFYLPWQPLGLIGIAVAFYLGFKNNSSYDRTWEARKIWGSMVNNSRTFGVAWFPSCKAIMPPKSKRNSSTATSPGSLPCAISCASPALGNIPKSASKNYTLPMCVQITNRPCTTTSPLSSPKPNCNHFPPTPIAPHRFLKTNHSVYKNCETPSCSKISAIWNSITSSKPFTKIRARASASRIFRFRGSMRLPPIGSPSCFVRLCLSDS